MYGLPAEQHFRKGETPMISIAIVEDEDSCAKQMEEYLARYAAESGEEFETVRF